jgi:peptidyl-Lys metalloendopeptidase
MRIARAAAAFLFAASFACSGPAGDDAIFTDGTGQTSSGLRPENPGLTATLSASRETFGAAAPVTVTLTIRNTGPGTLQLLRWLGPSADLEERLFTVSRDGAAVRYVGPEYKRASPELDDFLFIGPGRSISAEVQLSGAYDFSATGAYSIRYEVGSLKSNPVTLWVEGRQAAQPAAPSPGDVTTAGTISYTRCDATQQGLIAQAVTQATTYSSGSLSYLNTTTPGGTPRYTTWFGSYSSSGWSKARNDYTVILDAFQNKALSFNCGCKKKYYAYVYSNQPYVIYLCSVFWTAPMSGTDSKAGTLVHEMSHFDVTAGTEDWAYGQSACKSLANSDPSKALDNADSHEYFAENTPALQ